MTISSGSVPSPKYQRLAADLRRRIAAGEWRGDTALPVEAELEQQYGVARNTVRLAVDVLVNEGRLVRLQGKGTFLREHPVLDHRAYGPPLAGAPVAEVAVAVPGPAVAAGEPLLPAQRDGLSAPSAVYAAEADAAGRALTAEFEMLIVRARVDVAERLGLRPGEAVVVRRQLRLLDREPYSIEESHYRAGVAAGTALMEPDPVPGGDEAVLAALGRIEVGAVDQLVSRMPGPEEAQWFQGGPGIPLLVQTRVTYDRRGPVRVIETRYSADRCRLVYGLGELAARPRAERA
ncbi:GntR family transcriptional regulator [Kitasatospora sp. NBC_01287]|uniref:GntR family transcriptional regulator n=1 Tax=Kitasatospora sp. NBC_01287 TaxID=2903573 RepID=UPI002252386B|nr:GntR family transcriptional regulator [Kitasatospora sp. NBC_01287]MCX4746874.1 GntR family transcriptional regulator [Kitasatospora sp. NBC_01287]